ncbi:MAG: hypothetical protein J5I93_05215 [Pirellulaceae bacterium]|nr:hypothetical protein [Pirellulaceae bacterium]
MTTTSANQPKTARPLPVARPLAARPLAAQLVAAQPVATQSQATQSQAARPLPASCANGPLSIAANPELQLAGGGWGVRGLEGPVVSAVFHASLMVLLALLALPTNSARSVTLLLDESVVEEPLASLPFEMPLATPDEMVPDQAADLAPEAAADEDLSKLPAGEMPVELAALDLERAQSAVDALPDLDNLLRELDSLGARPVKAQGKQAPKLPADHLASLQVPENAVRAGAFCVFAEPPQPANGQPYYLIVQLQLPLHVNLRKFMPNDVSGTLQGTDGFRMNLPNEQLYSILFGQVVALPSPVYVLDGRQARWATYVPGAKLGVKDQVRVRSQVLGEEQTLQIEFGQVPAKKESMREP